MGEMKPSEAKAKYGATHYMPMPDGVTPEMYYRYSEHYGWMYLSFTNDWYVSGTYAYNPLAALNKLIEIKG